MEGEDEVVEELLNYILTIQIRPRSYWRTQKDSKSGTGFPLVSVFVERSSIVVLVG